MMPATATDRIIETVGELPPMPHVAAKVLQLLNMPETTPRDLQRVISTDQAMTSRVLRMSNSAIYGFARRIATLSHAIMILGFYNLRSIILAIAAQDLLRSPDNDYKTERNLLWNHSLTTAVTARLVATQMSSRNVEEAFVGGLLHDIGKSVMLLRMSESYGPLMEAAREGGEELVELERRELGFDHTALGARLLDEWGLASETRDTVEFHHDPERAPALNRELVCVVSLADQLCRVLGMGLQPLQLEQVVDSPAARLLSIGEDHLESLFESIGDRLEQERDEFLSI